MCSGYISDKVVNNGNKKRHRLIYECYFEKVIEPGIQIDHIDSKSLNNSILNLQQMTQSEHNIKTHSGKINKGKFKLGKPVTCFKKQKNGDKCNIKEYHSIAEASNAFNCKPAYIVDVLKKRQNTTKGYCWEYQQNKEEQIPGEKWVKLADIDNKFKGYRSEISSTGRIKSEYGVISYGTMNANGYCAVGVKGKNYLVHTLVATALHGKIVGDANTVDHINRIKTDNRKENLCWATRSEQQDNCSTKPINVYQNNVLIGHYKSFNIAANELQIERRLIGACIHGRQKTHAGYTFELVAK